MEFGEALRSFLESQTFAALCLSVDVGEGEEAVIVLKSSRDLLAELRDARANTAVGWVVDQTRRGPALCLVIRFEDEAVGELSGEVYFDVAERSDCSLLDRLARQERVRVAALDEELEAVWMPEVVWDEVRRLQAEQVRDRAEEFLERCQNYDFEEAKQLFQSSVSHDRLLARAFPEMARDV